MKLLRLILCATVLFFAASVAVAEESEHQFYGTATTDDGSSYTLTCKLNWSTGTTVPCHHYVRITNGSDAKVLVQFNDDGTSQTVSKTQYSVSVTSGTTEVVNFPDGGGLVTTARVLNVGAITNEITPQIWGR